MTQNYLSICTVENTRIGGYWWLWLFAQTLNRIGNKYKYYSATVQYGIMHTVDTDMQYLQTCNVVQVFRIKSVCRV